MAETTEKEQKVAAKCVFTSSTDQNATIVSINDDFAKISGYRKDELLGQNHNIVRHPDMPKIIFDIMWDKLKDNKRFVGIVKNRTKDGNYYWLVSETSTLSKKDDGSKVYYSCKKAAPKRAVFHINSLYKKLSKQEKKGEHDVQQTCQKDFLEDRSVRY